MAGSVERIVNVVLLGIAAVAGVAVIILLLPGIQERVQSLRNAGDTPVDVVDIAQAEQALASGDNARALQIAAATVGASSSDGGVDNRAGNVAQQAGDLIAAEKYYRLGESADDRNPWNYAALGELYARQGKNAQADVELRSALAIAPDVQFLHYDLGVVELKEHLAAAALADFKTELKRSPGYQPALAGEAQAMTALGMKIPLSLRALVVAAASPKPAASRLPSPSPSPSPSASPAASASPSVSPTPTATPTATPVASPSPLAIAQIVMPTATPSRPAVHRTPHPRPPRTAPPTIAVTTPPPSPVHTPRSMADVVGDAKSYLLGVSSDLGFTRAVPGADPSIPSSTLQAVINSAKSPSGASASKLIDAGASALLSGRLSLAGAAFAAASAKAPGDWRGPYLSGLTAQVRGDDASAFTQFTEAVSRGGGPEAYVSLAIVQVTAGDDAAALANAEHAAAVAPSYEPGRFTAGMIALISADVPTAERELQAALDIGGTPERTEYFLTTVRERM